MANVVEKLWGMINNIGVKNDPDYDEEDVDAVDYEEPEYDVEEEPEETGVRALFSRRPAAKTTTTNPIKMSIIHPTGFESAEEISDCIRERKSVVINLEYVNKDVARRIIDFVCGAAHVLDGQLEKVSSNIFVVVPSTYSLDSDVKEAQRANRE
jgi:cell division inhibitor SepF